MKNIGRLLTLFILLVMFAASVSAVELDQKSDDGGLGVEWIFAGSTQGNDINSNIKLDAKSARASETSSEEVSPFWDWFCHCNISVNYPPANQTMIYMSAQKFSFSLTDGYADNYYFQVNQDGVDNIMPYGIINIRIPFYYRDRSAVNYAVGLQSVQRYFPLDGSNMITSNGGQLYFSWDLYKKIAIFGAFGFNYYQASLDAGEIQPASPVDPGFYYDGEFIAPGTSASVTGVSDMAPSFYVGMKYYLGSWLFIEGSYSYFPSGVINDFNLEFGDYSTPVNLNPITISSDAVFSIGIGIGL